MAPAEILSGIQADGLLLELAGSGIALDGPDDAVARWLPLIREHKAGLLAALAGDLGSAIPEHQPDAAKPVAGPPDSLALRVGADNTVGDAMTPADARLEKAIDKLNGDPGLCYAMTAHDDIEPEVVILSLAIRGKGTCELRIPKSRYDAFALLELTEKHTTRATLQ